MAQQGLKELARETHKRLTALRLAQAVLRTHRTPADEVEQIATLLVALEQTRNEGLKLACGAVCRLCAKGSKHHDKLCSALRVRRAFAAQDDPEVSR